LVVSQDGVIEFAEACRKIERLKIDFRESQWKN